jgi:hypothetical protein
MTTKGPTVGMEGPNVDVYVVEVASSRATLGSAAASEARGK